MNGSNHLAEADKKPTYFCPDCLEKYCWSFTETAQNHFSRLVQFWDSKAFEKETFLYNNFIKTLKESGF